MEWWLILITEDIFIIAGYNSTERGKDCSTDNVALLVIEKPYFSSEREAATEFVISRVRYGQYIPQNNMERNELDCHFFGWGSRRNVSNTHLYEENFSSRRYYYRKNIKWNPHLNIRDCRPSTCASISSLQNIARVRVNRTYSRNSSDKSHTENGSNRVDFKKRSYQIVPIQALVSNNLLTLFRCVN